MVKITDAQGLPIFGSPVQFHSSDLTKAFVWSEMDSSDAWGKAQTQVTLGNVTGQSWIYATVNGISASDSMLITGLGTQADTILIYAGNNQSGIVNRILDDPLVVKVVDAEYEEHH